jgi:hypothetical protein
MFENEACWRKHTFVGKFTQDAPAVRALNVHAFVFTDLGLSPEDVLCVQLEVGLSKFFVKLRDPVKFKKIIEKTEYQFRHDDGVVSTLKVEDAGGLGYRVLRVFRLPLEINNSDVTAALAPYGNVVDSYFEKWTNYEGKGVFNGIRGVKIELRKDVPSYLRIRGVEALILYDGQPKTCRRCGTIGHLFFENKCPPRPSPQGRRWETAKPTPVTGNTTNNTENNNNKQDEQAAESGPGEGSGAAGQQQSPTQSADDEEGSEGDAVQDQGKRGKGRRRKRKKSGGQPTQSGQHTPSAAAAADSAGSTPPPSPPPRSSLSDHQAVELDKIFQFIEDQRGTVSFEDQDRAVLHVAKGGTYEGFCRLEAEKQTQLAGVITHPGKRKANSPKNNRAKQRLTGDTGTDTDDAMSQ